ncbi:hypothetical protein D1007_44514 [Hordeum vulgare]|nr:hypothetical protein D1007_44514 [Hordeum vulgare]
MPPPRDGAPTPTTSPPPSPGDTPSASKGSGSGSSSPPSSPQPASKGSGSGAGVSPPPSSPQPASKGSSPSGGRGTGDAAAAPPSSSATRGGSPPMASTSPASASYTTTPGVRDPALKLVETGHGKPAVGAHEEGGEVEAAKEEHTIGSDPVKTPSPSDSEKQLSSSPVGTGTGDAATSTPPASTSPRVHCGGSTPLASPSPVSTSRPTSPRVGGIVPEPVATVHCKPAASAHAREGKGKGKGKEKEDGDGEKDKEKRKGEHDHGCFGDGLFPWSAESPRDDDASAALKQQLLMKTRTSKPKTKVYVYQFETRFMVPGVDQSTAENNGSEMVKIGLHVLTRLSEDLDERRLYSILKSVVARYNGNQLITEQERVRWEIKQILTDQAQNFGIAIHDVYIVIPSFEKIFTQDIEEKEVTTQGVEQDNRNAMIRSQEDDQIWNKRQIVYIFYLGTALGIIFLIRPWLPRAYDRLILAAFAIIWGAGSVGLPVGIFGTSRLEKNCSRHVGRFISLSFSLLVIYAIFILTLNVAGTPPTPSVPSFGITDDDADRWTAIGFIVIAVLVSLGHLSSWIRV